MQIRIINFFITFLLAFSLTGFSQSNENSDHPLLDKYYPQKQRTDTNKVISNQIKRTTVARPAQPLTTSPVVTPKPVVNIPTIVNDTSAPVTPVVITTTLPSITTTSAVTSTPDATTISASSTTPVVNKPDTVLTRTVVQQKVQAQTPPAPPYMDTRLGSSTKQYDTWQKNSNGAGSVTTSPK